MAYYDLRNSFWDAILKRHRQTITTTTSHTSEKTWIVTFSWTSGGKSSEACEDYESELSAIREDLVDSLNAWVVKASDNSPLKADFNPGDKPTIVFLRNRVPVLYTGPANEEIMLETLAAYKETCTQALTDTSFEHLTQVS